MHVKAFGLMTRHPVKVEALPEDLRDVMPVDEQGRVDRPPRELRAEVFRRFSRALEPLRRARQARRDPAPVPVRTSSTSRSRSTTSSGRPDQLARRRAARRVPAPQLARRREPRADALVPRVARAHLRDRRRAEDRGEEPRPDRRRADEHDGLRPLPRPQRVHLEQAHGQRRRALRLPLLGGGARGVGGAAAGARARHRVGLRDVQQQRPLRDAVDRPRGDRARGGRRRSGEGRGGAGARRTRSCCGARCRRPASRSPERRLLRAVQAPRARRPDPAAAARPRRLRRCCRSPARSTKASRSSLRRSTVPLALLSGTSTAAATAWAASRS